MSQFSKKHYERVARILAENRPRDLASGSRTHHDKVLEAFIKMFKADNSRFKETRFREASRKI